MIPRKPRIPSTVPRRLPTPSAFVATLRRSGRGLQADRRTSPIAAGTARAVSDGARLRRGAKWHVRQRSAVRASSVGGHSRTLARANVQPNRYRRRRVVHGRRPPYVALPGHARQPTTPDARGGYGSILSKRTRWWTAELEQVHVASTRSPVDLLQAAPGLSAARVVADARRPRRRASSQLPRRAGASAYCDA